MKRIISILMCVIIFCTYSIPAFADNLTTSDSDISLMNTDRALYSVGSNGSHLPLTSYHDAVFYGSKIVDDGLIYFGGMGGESISLPQNYSIGIRILSFCRDTTRPTGYYMTTCNAYVYAFDSSVTYLHGEYSDNGSLSLTTPDGSKYYYSSTAYSQDSETGALKAVPSNTFQSSTPISVSATSHQALFCDLPIRFDDGTELSPPQNLVLNLDYALDNNYTLTNILSTNSSTPLSVLFFTSFAVDEPEIDYGHNPLTSTFIDWFRNYTGANDGGNYGDFLENYFRDYNSISELNSDGNEIDFTPYSPYRTSFPSYSTTCFSDSPAIWSFNIREFYNSICNSRSYTDYINLVCVATESDGTRHLLSYSFSITDFLYVGSNLAPPYGSGDDFNDYSDSGISPDSSNFSGLFSYLRHLFNTLSFNIQTYINNAVLSIRSFELNELPYSFKTMLQSINWHSLIGTGFQDFTLSDIFSGIRDIFSDTVIDTDYDLPALVAQLRPMLSDSQLSLPDLSNFLAPALTDLDIRPDGYFGNYIDGISTDLNLHLDNLFGDTQLALGDVNTNLGDLKTEIGDIKNEIQVSVGDLSAEINGNIRNTFVPDVDVINYRLERSNSNLKNKYRFIIDIKDGLNDVRESVQNSETTPPDLSFTYNGVRMYAVDWSTFDTYRSKIQNVLTAIAYILLCKYIFKTLPGTLGEGEQ